MVIYFLNHICYSHQYQNLYTHKIPYYNHEVQEGYDQIQICLLVCSLCFNFSEMHDITINAYFYIPFQPKESIQCYQISALAQTSELDRQSLYKIQSKYEIMEQPKLILQKLQCFLQKNFFNRHVEIICSREKFLYVRNVACMGSNSYMPICTA